MTDMTPGSPEWCRRVTASKVAAILGQSPWDSTYSVWCLMAGRIPPSAETPAMRRGNMLEDAILNWWLADHPAAIELARQPLCTLPGEEHWAAATPDMIVYADRATALTTSDIEIVDAKTAADRGHWGYTPDAVPAYYVASSMWQLAMRPDAQRVRLAVLFGQPFDLREYVVERDDELCGALIDVCRAFWTSVSEGAPPPLDDTVATYDAIRMSHTEIDRDVDVSITRDLADRWLSTRAVLERAETEHRAATTQLLDAMGKARRALCDDQIVARRQPHASGSVSLVRVAALPETGDTP